MRAGGGGSGPGDTPIPNSEAKMNHFLAKSFFRSIKINWNFPFGDNSLNGFNFGTNCHIGNFLGGRVKPHLEVSLGWLHILAAIAELGGSKKFMSVGQTFPVGGELPGHLRHFAPGFLAAF